jgi:Ser/Thr protein kinase RdoA (MazF antagonist)
VNQLTKVLHDHLGLAARRIAPLSETNNQVFRVQAADNTPYLLKCFDATRADVYQRVAGMRECLAEFSNIGCPAILRTAEVDDIHYALFEHVVGESLESLWDSDHRRASNEMERLGAMLASLHQIPVEHAPAFLSQEKTLHSEAYLTRMADTITPYLRAKDFEKTLEACFTVVTQPNLEHVVIHADFGPHQIIASPNGQWVVLDFEFAAIAPFADDLAGTEIHLEQKHYPDLERFLDGYTTLRPVLAEYEPVRSAFKALNLLAMLTYAIRRGQMPRKQELNRLSQLLSSVY